jgi:hypothetical protein
MKNVIAPLLLAAAPALAGSEHFAYDPDRTPLNTKQFDDLVQQVVDMRRGADLLLARPSSANSPSTSAPRRRRRTGPSRPA